MSNKLYLLAVAALPLFVIWILSFAFVDGFRAAWLFIGPVLAVIYPPIAVWLTLQAAPPAEQTEVKP